MNQVTNYRPISLLSIISKVFERIMAGQMVHVFESGSLFSDRQFGFRCGRDTVQGIIDLTSTIKDSFEDTEYLSALFCDLSKAFDCITHDTLLNKLGFYGFSVSSIRFLTSDTRLWKWER